MRVDEVLSVKQVDIRHGHVMFEGSLLVTGDVMPGMRIKTSGDVVIGGFVEGAISNPAAPSRCATAS